MIDLSGVEFPLDQFIQAEENEKVPGANCDSQITGIYSNENLLSALVDPSVESCNDCRLNVICSSKAERR